MLQAIMAKPCSLVTRARAKFINFFHPYTPMHGDTASRKDDVKPGHDCERWNVCLFVLPPAVLPQFQGVPSWNVYCSRFGNRCGGRICLYVPSLPGFDNTREFCCCPKTKSKYLLVRSFKILSGEFSSQ